jgi:hypothetical protein
MGGEEEACAGGRCGEDEGRPDERAEGEGVGCGGAGAEAPECEGAEPAAAAFAEPAFVAPNKRRALQARRVGGRKLFGAAARKVFLDWFSGTGNLSWAAKEAGVHYRTVLRHRMEDAEFRAAYDLAEAQSIPRLRAWLAQAKEEEARRLETGAGGEGLEPGGDPAPENLSVEQTMRMVEGWEKRQARGGASAGSGEAAYGPVGPGQGRGLGRVPTVASNDEVRDALVKRLRAFGIRVMAERGAGSPSTSLRTGFDTASRLRSTPAQDEREGEAGAIAPPLGCARSPSPSEPGEDL